MMKYTFIAALAIMFAASCADDDTMKPADASSPYSGRFDITYNIFDGNCILGITPDGASDITIRGDSIIFGSMKGPWLEGDKRGSGRYAFGTQCADHNPPAFCANCITSSFELTFASADSFSGTYGIGYTYHDCRADSCHRRYAITGKRVR
jgi:hypothetical protein